MFATFGTFFTPTVKIFKHFAQLLSVSCLIPRQICISQLSKNNIGLEIRHQHIALALAIRAEGFRIYLNLVPQ
jgi:hypothetical protein